MTYSPSPYLEEPRGYQDSAPHSKWGHQSRNIFPTAQPLPEYDSASSISYGNTSKPYYMLSTPSPEPPTIAYAMTQAGIALRLVPREGEYDGRPIGHHYISPASIDSSQRSLEVTISVVSSADKPFVCQYPGCQMPFGRQEHLKRHEKRHTGERPYKCEVKGCERYFARNDNLKQHRRTHAKPNSRARNRYIPGLKV